MKISDIMTENPKCVEPDDLITKARSLIRDSGFRALPVSKNGVLVGIITRGDILKITSTRTNLTVKGLMRAPIFVYPDDEVFYAAKKMFESEVRQLVVVEKTNNKIVGIVSSMDVLSTFIKEEYRPKKHTVSEIMHEPVFCNVSDEISKIWNQMSASGLSGFPVVKGKNMVVGFVTMGDIIRGGYRISKESGKQKTIKIANIMKPLVAITTPEKSISDVAEVMVKNRIIRVPVVDKEKTKTLLGIVDIEDVIGAYL